MTLQVRWQSAAERDLSRLDRPTQDRVIAAVERFAATGEGDVVRLRHPDPPEWRLRVGLRGYAQRFELFEQMRERMQNEIITHLFRFEPITEEQMDEQRRRREAPSPRCA